MRKIRLEGRSSITDRVGERMERQKAYKATLFAEAVVSNAVRSGTSTIVYDAVFMEVKNTIEDHLRFVHHIETDERK